MNAGHDLAPDILVEGCAAVLAAELLVFIAAAPYAGGVIRGIADKPDIVIVAGGTALAGCRHIWKCCTGAGRANADTGACKNTVGLHGIFHGIGQKECGGILQDPVSFRFIVNKQLSVVVEDFGKEYRFGVKAAVGNGSEGRGQLQVGHTFCDAAQCGSRVHVGIGQGGNAEVFGVFHTQLRAYGFHHGANCNNVHGVDNTIADTGVAEITLLVPVFKRFSPDGERRVIVDAPQGGTAGIERRGKRRDDLEGGTRLSGGIGCTV